MPRPLGSLARARRGDRARARRRAAAGLPLLAGGSRLSENRDPPRNPPPPLTAAEAQANVDQLIGRPHVRTPGELDGFWPRLRDAAGPTARGNQFPDAQLVALMRQHGVETIYTRDRDFRRYADVTVRDPFA